LAFERIEGKGDQTEQEWIRSLLLFLSGVEIFPENRSRVYVSFCKM